MALSPLGFWKLDETSGTTATDYSGNARHGTYAGTVTLNNIAGPYNAFPNFQGGRVSVADNTVWTLGTTPGLTIFALIKPDSVAAGLKFVVTKGAASNYEWQTTINSTAGRFTIESFNSADGNTLRTSTSTQVLGTGWQAIVTTLAGALNSSASTLYRNNNTPITPGLSGGSGTNSNGTAALVIGDRADLPSSALSFDGGIAYVATFAGVLDATQVGSIMTVADSDGWY
jgi:hypothetical protein